MATFYIDFFLVSVFSGKIFTSEILATHLGESWTRQLLYIGTPHFLVGLVTFQQGLLKI